MSNAIQFLESISHHPALIRGASRAYAEAVAVLDVDDAQREALLDRDHAALNALLNGRSQMLCAICAPDDEQEAIPDEGDVDGDGVPDDEPSPGKD